MGHYQDVILFTFQYGATITFYSISVPSKPFVFTFQYGATITVKVN